MLTRSININKIIMSLLAVQISEIKSTTNTIYDTVAMTQLITLLLVCAHRIVNIWGGGDSLRKLAVKKANSAQTTCTL